MLVAFTYYTIVNYFAATKFLYLALLGSNNTANNTKPLHAQQCAFYADLKLFLSANIVSVPEVAIKDGVWKTELQSETGLIMRRITEDNFAFFVCTYCKRPFHSSNCLPKRLTLRIFCWCMYAREK